MIELRYASKVNRNELLYVFSMFNNPNWKLNLIKSCYRQRIVIPKQGSLSDFEYFKLLTELSESNDHARHDEYFLLLDRKPIARLYIMYRTLDSVDLSFFVIPAYQHQGYATEATKLIETELFNNQNIKSITIMDKTDNKVSSKIATSLGYEYIEENDYFIKRNPNIKEQGVKLWE